MRSAIPCLTLIFTLAQLPSIPAQTGQPPDLSTPHPKKVLTPEQSAYQQALAGNRAIVDKLRATAVAAYNAEIAREKSPTCTNAVTTYDIGVCLSHENDLTGANLKSFTTTLRTMLATPPPQFPGQTPYIGPSGPEATLASNLSAFDAAELAWHAYATAECSAVDTYWRGGTIVTSIVLECNLRQSRARLHELDTVYSVTHAH